MKAIFQFSDYNVLEIQYKLNPVFEEDEASLSPGFSFDLEFSEEEDEALVYLGLELGDADLQVNSFYLNVKIAGNFIFRSEDEELVHEQKIEYCKINGVAILYPYLRALVSDITSKGSEQPIILPTMNVVEMLRRNEMNKKNIQE
ncbi:hypothetical protein B4134_0612 [Bacillus safensis]|uniref:protein-export chaperone SecB n=1 Tax=Bacillus TaxID=1386 RepID=UPI000597AAAB|nr:protein-export chaperone SecB [Bacillus safensis]KIL23302.1 hypothetical protein B4134_0612 [Bacillus safensis]MDV3451022.1 protein-export chaperone SecB [Bacillus safensis]